MKKIFISVFILILGTIVCFSFVFPQDIQLSFASASSLRHATDELNLSDSFWDDETLTSMSTIDDDFCDKTISVVLTRRASLQLRTHSVYSFPELQLSNVEHLSNFSEQNIEKQLTEMRSRTLAQRDTTNDINIETFRQRLRLTLQEPCKQNVLDAIQILERRRDVYAVSPNYFIVVPEIIEASYMYNNYDVARQTAFSTNNWGLNMINMPYVWPTTTGSSTVSVGIIDDGMDRDHPYLYQIIHPDMSKHYDFMGRGDPFAWGRHGTQVAGVIASQHANIGVARSIRLVSLRVSTAYTRAVWDQVELAIVHATAQNIPILNISLGSNGLGVHQGVRQALADFNGIAVIAAGNRAHNNDQNHNWFPSNLSAKLDNVISVSSTNVNDRWARHSSWGRRTVSLAAPGENIWTTNATSWPLSSIHGWIPTAAVSGTSFAAPHVAGTAALMLSVNPELHNQGALKKDMIMNTVDRDVSSCIANYNVAGGRLNAYRSVKIAKGQIPWRDPDWHQPRFTSNQNGHGIITASGYYPGRNPFGAFDGWQGTVGAGNNAGFPAAQWTKTGTSGFIQLQLNYYINVHRIEFFNRSSGDGISLTQDAYFVGTNGIALGLPFTAQRVNMGRTIVQVGGVRTNIIRLNITTSWGTSIGANEIVIHATAEYWHQPRWTSSSNEHGTITASHNNTAGRNPWGAFDGWTGYVGVGNSAGFPAAQWTINRTSGWLQLTLNYYIYVHQIEFFNRSSSGNDRTRAAYFTGTNGVRLGANFNGVNSNMGRSVIAVDNVRTNIIRLNITSSWGRNYVGANEIVIWGLVA